MTDRVYVSSVVDGDTFQSTDRRHYRLARVDTPERGQEGYEKAKASLQRKIDQKYVNLTDQARGHYNRIICEVWIGKTNINDMMKSEGY